MSSQLNPTSVVIPKMERCPVCRAKLKESSTCRRCGTDLSIPIHVEKEALASYQQSISYLKQGDILNAVHTAEKATELKREPQFVLWFEFLKNRN